MSLVRSFLRAVRLRCPHCGARGFRRGWIDTVACCSRCGLRLDRGESDYFLGAYTINLVAALLLAVGLAVLALTHPE